MDEGGFNIDYHSAPGTSLAETDRLLRPCEDILRQTPEVATYSRRTGLQLGGSSTEANQGDFFVQLKPSPRRGIEEVMDDVRTRVTRHVPGLEIEFAQLMEDLIGDLTSVPAPIEIQLDAEDEPTLDLYVYESFQTATAILFTTLLALPVVFLGLWVTGTELNITSMMGLTMIVGIATEVSIFLVRGVDEWPPDMGGAPALIQAAKNRMRPILMTTVSAVLAPLPLALGIGQGSAMQPPLAIAIICGLVAHLPIVLIVLPVLLPQPKAR